MFPSFYSRDRIEQVLLTLTLVCSQRSNSLIRTFKQTSSRVSNTQLGSNVRLKMDSENLFMRMPDDLPPLLSPR